MSHMDTNEGATPREQSRKARVKPETPKPDGESTADIDARICEHIACGASVKKACDEEHVTERGFFKRLIKDPKLVQEYARAREARAHAHAESVDNLKAMVLAGEIDAQTAKALFDMTRWQAGHEMAKVYGDKLDLTSKQDVNIDLCAAIKRSPQAKRAIAALISEDEG